MATKAASFYLVKAVRISGWLLLALMLSYIISGYALCGKFGFSGLIGPDLALRIHQWLDAPLAALLALHCLPSIYLAFKRWTTARKRR